ncbi:MAG: transketolase family protein [Bdellovibrionales bacterium]|nr:transketolase family protein [Bdellovibrionales bacterium]
MTKPVATRQAFGEALAAIGEKYPQIVVLDADLAKSTKSELFAKRYPDRFFECGISEANMIGAGAGLALTGKVPFICSFGAFVTGRFDQIRMSVAYTRAPVVIVGTHAGVGIGEDGHSQMALEDLATMRVLPEMLVLQPADDLETAFFVEELVKHPHAAYLRLTRQNVARVHAAGTEFRIGKIHRLREGKDVLVLATGGVVQEALAAALELEKRGIRAEVANVSSIKPLDTHFLSQALDRHKRVVTVEDHYIIGGMGSAVAEFMAGEGRAVRLHRIGVDDQFGQSGTPEELYDHYGLNAHHLAKKIAAFLG